MSEDVSDSFILKKWTDPTFSGAYAGIKTLKALLSKYFFV
jgi:hypothetical protein